MPIGVLPRPETVYPQPVVVKPAPAHVVQEPIYLRVPPCQAKNWKKHCAKYNACDRPVYFVRDKWYKNVYVPHYRAHQEEYGRGGRCSRDGRDRDDKREYGHGHYKD